MDSEKSMRMRWVPVVKDGRECLEARWERVSADRLAARRDKQVA